MHSCALYIFELAGIEKFNGKVVRRIWRRFAVGSLRRPGGMRTTTGRLQRSEQQVQESRRESMWGSTGVSRTGARVRSASGWRWSARRKGKRRRTRR